MNLMKKRKRRLLLIKKKNDINKGGFSDSDVSVFEQQEFGFSDIGDDIARLIEYASSEDFDPHIFDFENGEKNMSNSFLGISGDSGDDENISFDSSDNVGVALDLATDCLLFGNKEVLLNDKVFEDPENDKDVIRGVVGWNDSNCFFG